MDVKEKLVGQFIVEHGFATKPEVEACLQALAAGEAEGGVARLLRERGCLSDDDFQIVERVFPPGGADVSTTEALPPESPHRLFAKVVLANGTLPQEFVTDALREFERRARRGEETTMEKVLFELGFMTSFQIEEISKRMAKVQYRCEGCDKAYRRTEGMTQCPSCGLSLPRVGEVIPLEVGTQSPRAGLLRILVGTNPGYVYEVSEGSRVPLGRHTKNKVRVYGKNVSREHAELVHDRGRVVLSDKNSRFGTFLNGQRVKEAALADGDLLRIGASILEFRSAGRTATGELTLFGQLAIALDVLTDEALAAGLELQRSSRKGVKIGQILRESGVLSDGDVSRVLQEQRAARGLPEDQALFGAIAVSDGHVSPPQLAEALTAQRDQDTQGRDRIGEILVSKKYMDKNEVAAVLKKQAGAGGLPEIRGYEIQEKIGAGGMGTVYKAVQQSLERIVAIKVLSASLAEDKTFIRRFVTEARAAGRLNHASIIRAIDVGESGGHYYFAMEFVDGETVYELLKREGSLSEEQTIDIGLQMLRALRHAEQHGIVHRDIKPDNIMIDRTGPAKLCDLGLAKHTGGGSGVTRVDEAVGTPNYVSPEQAKGVSDIDIRADIYSLGATLYHMVTGQIPFRKKGSAIVIMAKHITDQIPNPHKLNPSLSRNLCKVLEMMMVKDRDKRYQKPDDVIEDLERVRKGKAPKLPRIISAKSTISKEM